MSKHDNVITVDEISRLEIIDGNGRAYVNMNVDQIVLSTQDDDKTLKIFVTSTEKTKGS